MTETKPSEKFKRQSTDYQEQLVGGVAGIVNEQRVRELNEALFEINTRKDELLGQQRHAFEAALKEVESLKERLGSPENILGRADTKHGEIAEFIEVHIRRAKDLLNQAAPNATFDGVGRTAPEDYIVDGIKIQSKFINNTNNNLNHILKHIKKYTSIKNLKL